MQRNFAKVLNSTLVRCVQKINHQRTFYVGMVQAVKKVRPYKVGKLLFEEALMLRTTTGPRTVGLDALSNEAPSDAEFARFKVNLEPALVRKQIRYLQQAMQECRELFEEEDLRRKIEEEEKLRAQQEAAAEREQREADERERKEREREDLRRRQAERSAAAGESEQWWLQYQQKGDNKQREVAKWKARLARFEKIANSTTAEGERENAQRLAEQAKQKVDSLMESED